MREHVRRYLRTAFGLHSVAAARRAQAPRVAATRAPDVETDWNRSALALRVRRAMSQDEPLRVREHDGTTHSGRAARLHNHGPAHGGSRLAVELDGGQLVPLATVASIGLAARRVGRDRREPRLAACVHPFGYRGHCLTKSRRYSTTSRALRAAREAFVHEQGLARSRDATQRALTAGERVATFTCVGTGHITAADAYLPPRRPRGRVRAVAPPVRCSRWRRSTGRSQSGRSDGNRPCRGGRRAGARRAADDR